MKRPEGYDLASIRLNLASLRLQLALLRLPREQWANPLWHLQPRAPRGVPEGGQWIDATLPAIGQLLLRAPQAVRALPGLGPQRQALARSSAAALVWPETGRNGFRRGHRPHRQADRAAARARPAALPLLPRIEGVSRTRRRRLRMAPRRGTAPSRERPLPAGGYPQHRQYHQTTA